MWAEEQQRHEASECDMRGMLCPNPRCGRTVPFKELETHRLETCDHRLQVRYNTTGIPIIEVVKLKLSGFNN